MNKKLKKIPVFKNEKEEREFWQSHDSTEYVDYSNLKKVSFPNLKLTSKPVTFRVPVSWIERLKVEANKRDMPYQSLMKQLLYRQIKRLGMSG